MITERVKKSICALLACVTTFSLIVPGPAKVSAASNVTVNLTAEKQVIRGFGGMNHPAWIGDLTPVQRETAFGNGKNQLGFSVLRIYIDPDKNNWQREVETAKNAIEHGAIVFATPWNPPSEMLETFTLGMSQGNGTTYEAETGTTLTDSAVSSAASGYTGTGYVDFQAASNAGIQWNNVTIGTTGKKNIKIRYALESGTSEWNKSNEQCGLCRNRELVDICTKYEFCEKVPKKRPDDGPIFLFLFSHTLLQSLIHIVNGFSHLFIR
ncbi:hypothetical protein C7820_1466 [Paenibacillus sp. VMFN-D1]|nr:hypothetical protein C7820_1466 [Paenibacillus sp. VMFN-D1]